MMTLQDVLDFKVGTRLMLNASPTTEVELRCGPVPMFRGRMGRRGNNIAIALDRVLTKVARQT
jgi:flagellar motor switch protein FliM